jgi:hypothetical protein
MKAHQSRALERLGWRGEPSQNPLITTDVGIQRAALVTTVGLVAVQDLLEHGTAALAAVGTPPATPGDHPCS